MTQRHVCMCMNDIVVSQATTDYSVMSIIIIIAILVIVVFSHRLAHLAPKLALSVGFMSIRSSHDQNHSTTSHTHTHI